MKPSVLWGIQAIAKKHQCRIQARGERTESETLSGPYHQVLDTRRDEVAGSACEHGGTPRLEDGATVRPEILPLVLVRDTRSEGERCASCLRTQGAKRNKVYIFSVEEIKAACDQVSQVAKSRLGQTGGLPGDVGLHFLKSIVKSIANLRGEGRGQKALAGNVLTDVSEHGDVTKVECDV